MFDKIKKPYFFILLKTFFLGYDKKEMAESDMKKTTNKFLKFSDSKIEKNNFCYSKQRY